MTLRDTEAHHALHVLRVKAGERVVVLDGVGHEFLGEIGECGRQTVEIKSRQRNELTKLRCELTLVQAVIKGKGMELIIQKATELGASSIIPVISARSVPQIEDEDAQKKVEKWRAIAVDSIKQCGSGWLPRIEPPRTVQQTLASRLGTDLTFVASLQPDSRHPRHHLKSFEVEHARPPRSVAVWVGPEGDFTPAELNAIKSAGALPITLGPLVLRSDTAAIYSLAVLDYDLQ